MQRTEQQEKIEQTLLELIECSKTPMIKGNFEIRFIQDKESCFTPNNNRKVSESYLRDGKVYLELVEPKHENNLDDWTEAIVNCFSLFDKLEKIEIHKLSNPIFFEAIKHRIYIETK
jgi:hypothetical protein